MISTHSIDAKYVEKKIESLSTTGDHVTAPTELSCASIHLIDSPALAKWSPLWTDDSVSNRAVDSLHQTFRLA